MPISSDQLAADSAVPFLDWGRTVTFQQVSAEYTPETGEITELLTETPVTAIVGPLHSAPAAHPAGQEENRDVEIIFPLAQLPAGEPRPTSRLVVDGVVYAILSHTIASDASTITLACRRLN